jgi:ribulose-5-phosphate 4-epimerase/fuculose-1-phosphate aldolase
VLLKLRIEQLLLHIKKLERRLKAIKKSTLVVVAESGTVVTKKSGVPRAEYAYHKGRYAVARQVTKLLRGV